MDNNAWYEIENDFWCPCQDQLNSLLDAEDHPPECLEHKVLMKVSSDMEYLPGDIPKIQHGKKRNSVVDEFLANLETLNTSRRRSSSKLLPGFVPIEEIVPSVLSRIPGLEVYLPACFSPTKLETLECSLDQDIFQFLERKDSFNLIGGSDSFERRASEIGNVDHADYCSDYSAMDYNTSDVPNMANIKSKAFKTTSSGADNVEALQETAKKLASCSLVEDERNKMSTTQRNLAERLRRNTLNEKFSTLQTIIPDIANNKKVSKLKVIKSTIAYIKKLEQEERFYSQMKAVEKEKNRQLLLKLAQYNTT